MFPVQQDEQCVDAACKALACTSVCLAIKQLSSLFHFMPVHKIEPATATVPYLSSELADI